MEIETLADSDPLAPAAVAAGPGCSDGVGAVPGAGCPSAPARRRTPGRWRRIPRAAAGSHSQPPSQPSLAEQAKPGLAVWREAERVRLEREEEERQMMLKQAEDLERRPDDEPLFSDSEEARAGWIEYKAKFSGFLRLLADGSVSFRPTPPPSDTLEEHLTAEDMEKSVSGRSVCPQAHHFAMLALSHYNTKKRNKFEMSTVLLSKCFSELDGTTFAHVNFTASPLSSKVSPPAKRLFFAELMLVPELMFDETKEPMRVLHVCTIDDFCYGVGVMS
ncbi:hypothetical protein ACP4OV_006800 [Aristida adscensionis]